MNPHIRPLEQRDIDTVYQLGMSVSEFAIVDGTHRFWPKDTLEKFVTNELSFVVEEHTQIVGFLLATYQPVTKKLTWENMYLDPAYRRQGLAQACFHQSWIKAQQKGAVLAEGLVEVTNSTSQQMLEHLGFHNAGTYSWMLKFSS